MSYNRNYDASDSRRSPRDQSPGRYNDSRDGFRGGAMRGGERRRSIDARMNPASFNANRELFGGPTSRDLHRDFPPRDPPRGPKAYADVPTGPRASDHSHFRGDSGGGFRGDYRGERGRGRGRGWREDSRDRGREPEREFRDRRDERPPPPSRIDDRGRDRWGPRESFRGRRASSPPGRGRSPNYGSRDSRDGPPNIEIDRARRESRDGPLSGGSPASESMGPFRGGGYTRAPRGGRGRGRGGFYEDGFHRPAGRSRSPELVPHRRTQPSATPPPQVQVPAFGSTSVQTSTTTPFNPFAPNITAASTTTAGPIPGVAVPTAPRSVLITQKNGYAHAAGYRPEIPIKKDPRVLETNQGSISRPATQSHVPHKDNGISRGQAGPSHGAETGHTSSGQVQSLVPAVVPEERKPQPPIARRPKIGQREIPPKVQPLPEEASESDSDEDEITDSYFVDEIARIDEEVAKVIAENSLNPRPEPPAVFLRPFVDFTIDNLVHSWKTTLAEPCKPPHVKMEETLPSQTALQVPLLAPKQGGPSRSRSSTPAILPKPKPAGRSRPSTPSVDSKAIEPARLAPNVAAPAPEPHSSARTLLPSVEPFESQRTTPMRSIEPDVTSRHGENQASVNINPVTNGTADKSVPMDVFSESEGEMTEAENLEVLEAVLEPVRPRMKTPPISSLLNLGNKKWFEDPEFMEKLKPNPVVNARIRQKLMADNKRKLVEKDASRNAWGDRYHRYRLWTDFESDPVAVRSREKFAKARADEAAEAAAQQASMENSAGAKPEGSRRGRFATEADFERVLQESALEAKESQDKVNRAARAKTASAKEATIPDAAWGVEEREATRFIDRSHLVPFERSFAVLEFGEPIDNFTPEESEIFEKVYLEFPKQWSKIAAALSRRDYKACIQHYYLIKHTSSLKEKLKRQPKKRKSRTKAKNPKSNALMADLGANRDETEDADGENGERRRPRRAAAPTFNSETMASESEVASPMPTPGRKSAAAPRGDIGSEATSSKKKARTSQKISTKQNKNSQLLAAAPSSIAAPSIPAGGRNSESPATPAPTLAWNRSDFPGPAPAQYQQPSFDGPAQNLNATNFTSSFPAPSMAPPNPPMPTSYDPPAQIYPASQERFDSAPGPTYDTPQSHRTMQQTSSYWSVPEQTDFPELLKHFGTDWHGIAKHMTSKTHIMVYTTVFQQWLIVPSDSNKSRRVANIQTQVKNYYQRQVDSGKRDWELLAQDADAKKGRNEDTGPLPTPTVIPRKRYDLTPGSNSRSVSSMDQRDEMMSSGPIASVPQASPPRTSIAARFPALAQAGPVPQIQPAPAPSTPMNKHMPPQPPQPAQQPAPQQLQPQMQQQQQPRPTRGPALGFFSNDSPRPIKPTVSQSAVMAVVQEAQLERQSALRLEQEQKEQQQLREREQQLQREQQEAIQVQREQILQREQQALQREQRLMQQRDMTPTMHRDRHLHMKQENETPNPHQYEAFGPAAVHSGTPSQQRPEPSQHHASVPPSDFRRTAPPQHSSQPPQLMPQHYQPRSGQIARSFPGDAVLPRENKPILSPAVPRPTMSAPPANHEMYPVPPPSAPQPLSQSHLQPAPAPAAIRQPEPARKSNIMSLLNDEPSDPRPPQPTRISDAPSGSMQQTHTPPPQHQLHPSRFPPPQGAQQTHPHMAHTITNQPQTQHQAHASPHAYTPSTAHPLHQHSSSVGHSRTYTPTDFDSRSGYGQQQQSQQPPPMFAQAPPRQSMAPQPPQVRREPSLSDAHGISGSGTYARASLSGQPSMRLKESPYSATPPPQISQNMRQTAGSPLDMTPDQRDYYQRQPQPGYFTQQQQQTQHHAAASPQPGPSYQSQSQQPQQPPQSAHRNLVFNGQNSPHVPSPPTQYASQHAMHQSRHNSFDSRYQMGAPGPAQSSASSAGHSNYSPLHGSASRMGASSSRIMTEHERMVSAEMERRREAELRRAEAEDGRERSGRRSPDRNPQHLQHADRDFLRPRDEFGRPR